MDTENKHMGGCMVKKSKSLLSLINNILEIAKMEARRREILLESLNPLQMGESLCLHGGVLGQRKGLAIVRNLCQMMNGTVQVTSKLGVGSTFTVTLPLKPVPTPEPIAI